MKEDIVIIFTDGASRGNPGPGGYGAIIFDQGKDIVTETGGYEKDTTNNRMELRAAIEALITIRKNRKGDDEFFKTVVYSDSAYVLNGITKWVYAWEKNNWMTGQKEGVLNQDLWEALLELSRERDMKGGISWKKVSGHAGSVGNERCDEIATSFADQNSILLFSGSIADYEKMMNASIDTMHETKSTTKKKSTSSSKKGVGYSYVSLVDGVVSVDKTWAACEKRVKGKKGAKYKKAMNKEEESDLVALYSFDSLV